VVRFEQNLGFSRAVNEAARQCNTQYIMVLNNDAVLAPDCLARLYETAADYGAGFAAPMVTSEKWEGVIDGAWDLLAMSGCALRAGHGRKAKGRFLSTRPITFAPFTAILVKRALFERMGGLNEEFGTYMEDVEFCLRCAMDGESGVYVPLAKATHLGSATDGVWSPRMVERISRNQLLIVALHWPRPLGMRLAWTVCVGQALWGFSALLKGRFGAWVKGKRAAYALWDEMRARPMCSGSQEFYPILQESDLAVREIAEGAYWRAYRLLTPSGGW
jgi:GT2 family glycosyltransferase